MDGVTQTLYIAGPFSIYLRWSRNSTTTHFMKMFSPVKMPGLSISMLPGAATAFSLLLTLKKQQR